MQVGLIQTAEDLNRTKNLLTEQTGIQQTAFGLELHRQLSWVSSPYCRFRLASLYNHVGQFLY